MKLLLNFLEKNSTVDAILLICHNGAGNNISEKRVLTQHENYIAV